MATAQKQSLTHLAVVAAALLVLGGAGALTNLASGRVQDLVITCSINVAVALSLMLLLGLAGQFSLGHAGFLASGAYVAIVIAAKAEFYVPLVGFFHGSLGLSISHCFSLILALCAVAGTIVTMLLGLIVGLPTLRLRGDYLAIATLGFGEIVRVCVQNSPYLKATSGIQIGERTLWLGGQPKPLPPLLADIQSYMNTTSEHISAFTVMAGALFTLVVVRNLKYSTAGRALQAIREDLIAAESVGVPTTRYKVSAFTISAALAGLAGALLSHHTALTPDSFDFTRSITFVAMVILGGQGSITGTVLAAITLTVVPEMMRGIPNVERWRLVIYALVIILTMLFRPQGIFGRYEITDLGAHFFKRKKKTTPQESSAAIPAAPIQNSRPAPAGTAPLLEARGMTMQFGGLRAVDSFSLTLHVGELVGLIGPNGAGKTTVFNVLTGVYRATAGDIHVRGQSTARYKPHTFCARGVARTFQNIRLFQNLTVLENVLIAQHMHQRHGMPAAMLRTPGFFREEAQSRRDAMEFLDLFNLGPLAGECASSLSYGDQRRLEIARALATRPCLLLLDEPAAGMNPTEKRQLMDLIRDVRTRFGLAILLIEHDMKVIMGVCERIVVLDYGKTIAQGTPDEIRRHPAVIEAYLGASAKQG